MKNTWKRLLCLLMIGALLIAGALAESVDIDINTLDQGDIQIETGDDVLALEDAIELEDLELDESLDLDLDLEDADVANMIVEASEAPVQAAVVSNETPAEYFDIDADGVVIGYTGPGATESITVPATTHDGQPVIGIGEGVFEGMDALNYVTLPATIKHIDARAFSGSGLKSIALPASLRTIGDEVFSGCWLLASVQYNDKLREIGDYAFKDCVTLAAAGLPAEFEIMGKGAFSGCAKLASANLGRVTEIPEELFQGCASLASITIPNKVTEIGDFAFKGCAKLTAVTVPAKVTEIGTSAFEGCAKLATASLNSGLSKMGDAVFKGCKALSTIELPSSLTAIPAETFLASGLKRITIPNTIKSIGADAFKDCASLATFTFGTGITTIPAGMFPGCDKLSTINIPEGIKAIEERAFYCFTSLASMKLPNSVTSVGESAFGGCKSLTSFTFGTGMKTIPGLLFMYDGSEPDKYECKKLATITIPDGVTEIGEDAFRELHGLKSVSLPDTLEIIGSYAFYDCRSLASIVFPESLTTISERAFSRCRLLDNVKLPPNLYILEEGIFSGCDTLSNIDIPDGVAIIGARAFYDCGRLVTVSLPVSVSRIENGAFLSCYRLENINIPSAVTFIGYAAFSDCASLATLTLPRALRKDMIMPDAFESSDKLVCEVYKKSGAYYFCKDAKSKGLLHDYHVIGTPVPTPPVDISKCTIASIKDRTYTGNKLRPAVTITYNGTKLEKGTDYTVKYSKNRDVGKAKATIVGIGKFTGTEIVSFKINPKKTAITKLTKGVNQFKVTWKKKAKQLTGYQVQYSTSSDFSNAKKKTISDSETTSTTIKNLKTKTTYYVRVRTYHVVRGNKYYSDWSSVKNITTK